MKYKLLYFLLVEKGFFFVFVTPNFRCGDGIKYDNVKTLGLAILNSTIYIFISNF